MIFTTHHEAPDESYSHCRVRQRLSASTCQLLLNVCPIYQLLYLPISWHDCYLWSEGLGYWFYLASDKSVWACQHSSTACIQLVWDYRITGNFSWCKILRKCCIHFRTNFRSFYSRVSRMWQLTTPLNVNEKLTQLPTFLRQGISSLRKVAKLSQ